MGGGGGGGGEAVIEGQRIPSSNVDQLVYTMFTNRRKVVTSPVGIDQLIEALAMTDFHCQS